MQPAAGGESCEAGFTLFSDVMAGFPKLNARGRGKYPPTRLVKGGGHMLK